MGSVVGAVCNSIPGGSCGAGCVLVLGDTAGCASGCQTILGGSSMIMTRRLGLIEDASIVVFFTFLFSRDL